MKKYVWLFIIIAILFFVVCSTITIFLGIVLGLWDAPSVNKEKRERLEIYNNDENFITLTGKIVDIKDSNGNQVVKIENDEINQYLNVENFEYDYVIYSQSILIFTVGDVITFTTCKKMLKYDSVLPIIEVIKDGEYLLDYQTGKANLINSVNQIQYK